MFVVLDGDVPTRLTLDHLILHAIYREVDDIVLDGHFVAGALVASYGVTLVYGNVVESTSVDSVHGVVFPHEMLGVGATCEMAQPRCRGRIVDAMSSAGDELHMMAILARMATLEAIEELMGTCRE